MNKRKMTCKRLQSKIRRWLCDCVFVQLCVCVCVCMGLSFSLIIPRLRQIEGILPFVLNLYTIYPQITAEQVCHAGFCVRVSFSLVRCVRLTLMPCWPQSLFVLWYRTVISICRWRCAFSHGCFLDACVCAQKHLPHWWLCATCLCTVVLNERTRLWVSVLRIFSHCVSQFSVWITSRKQQLI